MSEEIKITESGKEEIEIGQTSTQNKSQVIEYRDASSEGVKLVISQLGSDKKTLMEGRIDNKRLTNIDKIERLWLTWFLRTKDEYGGEYMKGFCNDYLDLSMGIEGERAKLLIQGQWAVSGSMHTKKGEDKRNWIEKHITKRGQEPQEVLDVGLPQ